MFPSLINCCTIDWFDRWPDEALLSVSRQVFEPIEIQDDRERVRDSLPNPYPNPNPIPNPNPQP